jgi:hypothetical protein
MVARTNQEWLRLLFHLLTGLKDDLSTILRVGSIQLIQFNLHMPMMRAAERLILLIFISLAETHIIVFKVV